MTVERRRAPDGLLLDMDGVLTVSFEPIPGSVDALHRLRAMSVPFKIVTNWTGMDWDDEIDAEKPASTRASDDIMIRGSLLFNA